MKIVRALLVLLILGASLGANEAKPKLPENGVIPDEATAVAVARAIFGPVYGKDYVDKYLPYHAQLERGVWAVYGSLPRGSMGGTPELQISKQDGRVLEIWHSQ